MSLDPVPDDPGPGDPGGSDPLRTPTPLELRPVVNRIKRAQGQLAGVLRMVEGGRDLESVVQQLKAVGGALDRAGFALVALDLRRSLAEGDEMDDERLAEIEKLVLSLA